MTNSNTPNIRPIILCEAPFTPACKYIQEGQDLIGSDNGEKIKNLKSAYLRVF